MAVVPYEKQIEEFERALANSLDYSEARDQVHYIQYGVERADVTDSPAVTDPAKLTWTKLGVKAALLETDKWSGFPEEVLDPNYMDYEVLTHPAPPFMQRDLWDILTHPDVPLLSLDVPGTVPGAQVTPSDVPPADIGGDLPSDTPRVPGGDGMTPRGARGGQMPGEGGGIRGSRPRPPRPGMGTGEGMSPNPYGTGSPTVAIPKYKLIRFNDLTIAPGRQYRYRLCLYLEDPNHPRVDFAPPSVQSLDETVRARLKVVDANDEKTKQRTYWVTSDWSEPSGIASLPSTQLFFAGKVNPPAASEIMPGKPRVPAKEPTADVLTVVWDADKAVDVPAEKEVQRGSTLNFINDADVIHPVLGIVRKLEKHAFTTNAMVADMLGGETIPPLDRKNEHPLQVPGEVLIFDEAGNLHVQNETDDVESFRRYLLPEPVTPGVGQPGGDVLGQPPPGEGGVLDGPGPRRPVRPRGA